MTIQILRTAFVLLIVTVAIIHFIGDECGKNFKEWLVASIVGYLLVIAACALVLIWA
jgi:hypothetical protein